MNKATKVLTVLLVLLLVSVTAFAQSGARGAARVTTYTLSVVSNAPNSRVFINAVAQAGVAPMDLVLNAGDYELVVRAPGYQDYTTKVALNRDLTINARLMPLSYRLQVTSNAPGSTVYVNGSSRGAAPANVTLQAGEYQVSVRANGYESYETTVNLNRDLTVGASLKPLIFNVTMNVNVKGASVFVNGTARGSVPATLALQMGQYTIRVVAEGYLENTQTVNVTRDTTLNVNLQPAFATVVVSIPTTMYNPLIKDAQSLFQIYVDERPVPEAELRQMRFQVTPGRHTFWFITGGLLLEEEFVIVPGKTYVLMIGADLLLEEPGR